MKSYIVGASGQVGGAIYNALIASQDESLVVGTYSKNKPPHLELCHLDITDEKACLKLLDGEAGHVYLASSYTNVDGCEKDPEFSHLVNVQGASYIVEAARKFAHKLIYFSSEYVFDGKDGPYDEEALPSPISVYGRDKVEAERLVLSLADALVLRTTVVYGREWQGKNFVLRLIKTLREGNAMMVPFDQVGSPTYAPSLAEAAIALARCGEKGIFNTAGQSRVSRYQFALDAAEVFALDGSLIKPVSTESLKQPAARPLEGGLVVDKILKLFPGFLPGHKEGLGLLKTELKDRAGLI